MEDRAVRDLTHEGYSSDDIETRRAADLRYVGQAYELTVPCPSGRLDAVALGALAETFHDEHERTYGHRAGEEPVEIVNLRLTAMGTAGQVSPTRPDGSDAAEPRREDRSAYFGTEHGHRHHARDRTGRANNCPAAGAADHRRVRRYHRRATELHRQARRRRKHRHRGPRSRLGARHAARRHRPDHLRGDPQRTRHPRRRDGPHGHAHRALGRRQGRDGLLHRVLRPKRAGGRPGPSPSSATSGRSRPPSHPSSTSTATRWSRATSSS